MATEIVIVGRGYMAGRLQEYFGDRAISSPVDILDMGAVNQVLDECQPQVLINAAAKTNTHEIEKPEHQDDAFRVNVQGPANLAYCARQHGVKLVHLSTAMMFDGEQVDEDALPEPSSYYAWTKAWAESELKPFADRDGILIARLHTPLSQFANPRNLLTKLQNFSSVVDTPGSVTVVEDFLSALDQLIAKRATGIFNITNPGSVSMYWMIEQMKEHGLIAADKEVPRLSKDELDRIMTEAGKAKQTFPIMSTDKLLAAGVTMRSAEEAVLASIKDYQS